MSPALPTNTSSKFTPFSLTLLNGATTTGISHIPTHSPTAPSSRPLLIGVHGGTCTAHNFDINPSYTASIASQALGVPFVAFNRPSYSDSSPLILEKDSSFHRETGRWEHEYILPALWEKFGVPNHCTGVVLLCHSMAVPGAIVAASLWALDTNKPYPLAGLILSGWGTTPKVQQGMELPPPTVEFWKAPTQGKVLMMLGEAKDQSFDPEILAFIEPLNVPMPLAEGVDGRIAWWEYGPGYAKEINVPIMYAMGECDWLWEGSKKYVKAYEEWFPKCPRFDGSTVLGAPHALEWSRVCQRWYVRCFGWALEVCGL
jgi:hypothetical protein